MRLKVAFLGILESIKSHSLFQEVFSAVGLCNEVFGGYVQRLPPCIAHRPRIEAVPTTSCKGQFLV